MAYPFFFEHPVLVFPNNKHHVFQCSKYLAIFRMIYPPHILESNVELGRIPE